MIRADSDRDHDRSNARRLAHHQGVERERLENHHRKERRRAQESDINRRPTQALQPRIFCKPNFEIDPTASGGASAHSEFSETKGGPVLPGDARAGSGHEDGGRAVDIELGDHGQKL